MTAKKKNSLGSYLLAASLLLGVLFVAIWAIIYPAFEIRLRSDFWPVDRSYIAPNIVAAIVQAVVVVIALSLFYPPFRHWIEKSFTRHKKDLTDHTDKAVFELHEKLDHVIRHHPDIPKFVSSAERPRSANGRFSSKITEKDEK